MKNQPDSTAIDHASIDTRTPGGTQSTTAQPRFPWQQIKPSQDDLQAPARVQAIMQSPSYRQADRDVDFLNLDATRAVRLQIDYLKPELALTELGVEHTIVVFGSTRIKEPRAAQREVDRLKKVLAEQPTHSTVQRELNVALQLEKHSHYYEVARALGRLIGTANDCPSDCRVILMTGGGPGIMEASHRGTFDVEAKSVGLNISLPHEQYPNPYITPELCFRFHYFAMRKLHFLLRARALVAFPGGYGTFDELFEALTLVQTHKVARLPIVLVGKEFWQQAVNFDFLLSEGMILPEDRELFTYAETAEDIWHSVLRWHDLNGTPLY